MERSRAPRLARPDRGNESHPRLSRHAPGAPGAFVLDRLFLKNLVEELSPRVRRRRIRGTTLDRRARILSLFLGPPGAHRLVWSFLPEAAGVYLLETARPPKGGEATPALKKWLGGSTIAGLSVADLDRIATLSFGGTRLSGRTTSARLVLELIATRADLYLIEEESSTILETFSSSRPRLASGETYRAPPPPPQAAPLASDVAEFEERLSRRSGLLAASGATPLLVREMTWLIEREGRSESEAFARIGARLEEKRPVLYVRPGRPPLLSPFALSSEIEHEPREIASFSEAMAEAVALATAERALRETRRRLGSAIAKRLSRSRRLRERLSLDASSLEEPSVLRGRGERLLAGLSRSRRSDGGRRVAFPDPFDPEERTVEIEIDPRLSLPANAERFFARARKAERSRAELAKRLEKVEQDLSRWEALEVDLRDAVELSELEALEEEAIEEGVVLPTLGKSGKARPALPPVRVGPRSFLSHRGSPILVGRSGRSNDELTFDLAHPSDLWFHASGMPGAHVVLRVPSGSSPDEREVAEAAELAAYFSKGRESTGVDVTVTERRNVSRIRGAPRGLVKVKNARTVRVAPRVPGGNR